MAVRTTTGIDTDIAGEQVAGGTPQVPDIVGYRCRASGVALVLLRRDVDKA